MNCKPVETLLLGVVDGRATAEERDRVSGHVATCEACARHLEELGATWSALDELPTVEPSPWFDTRLAARMREPLPKTNWLGRLPAGMRWIAVTAALVAMAVWISLRLPAGRPAPAPNPQNRQDFAVIQNLPALENYDVISNFEALSALPGAQTVDHSQQME